VVLVELWGKQPKNNTTQSEFPARHDGDEFLLSEQRMPATN
jgi:hypothetical protein